MAQLLQPGPLLLQARLSQSLQGVQSAKCADSVKRKSTHSVKSAEPVNRKSPNSVKKKISKPVKKKSAKLVWNWREEDMTSFGAVMRCC